MKKFSAKKLLLLTGDLAVLYISLYITLAIRYQAWPTSTLWNSHFWPFTIVFLAWIIIFYISNLYNLHLAVNNARFFQMTNQSLVVSIIFSLAFFYAIPQITIAPKTNLLIYVFIFYILFFLWRRAYNVILKSYLPKRNIAIIGYNDQVKDLIEELKAKPHLGYNVSFILNKEGAEKIDGIQILGDTDNLIELIQKHKITTVILNANLQEAIYLRSALFSCLPLKLNYINLTNFYENITGKVPIDIINQMWFLENLSEGNKSGFDLVKRIYDIVLSIFLFAFTIIFWPLIAVIIKVESKGPVFFTQMRAGKNNKPFLLYKFRTMKEEGNDRSLTSANDNRVTKFGSFLRKSRIDELPQIINILKAEMSFVGPRPERPEYVTDLEKSIPFYRERTLVKPGITGWDQVSGEYHSPSLKDSIKKLQYDLFYIKNRSIYLDISIILRTVATVLLKEGR